MRLAIVLSTRGDLRRASRLALAARDRGVDVDVFAMDEGVAALTDGRAELQALLDADCDVIACASSAHARGLGEAEVGVMLGSQDDHAAIVHRAAKVVAFT